MSDLVADYDFAHPPGSVAQVPAERRDQARLLCVERLAAEEGAGTVVAGQGRVADLPRWLAPGDLLVLNDVAVRAARLVAWRETGGRVSVLVLAEQGPRATVLLGARGQLRVGEQLRLDDDRWELREDLGQGRYRIEVTCGRDPARAMAEVGRMPLPPYIVRDPQADPRDELDRERYRTTFCSQAGAAVAAPTAGLHFTLELLARCQAAGVELARLRLDVGEGTFRPMRSVRLDQHPMHAEDYFVPEQTARAFEATRARGGRVVAVGTTVLRALESALGHDQPDRPPDRPAPASNRCTVAPAPRASAADRLALRPGPGSTSLFIRPGYRFGAVDALLTNFHQPRSTLLVLVCAFAGRETILAAYDRAVADGYRLFSYGDAMLLAHHGAQPKEPRSRSRRHDRQAR